MVDCLYCILEKFKIYLLGWLFWEKRYWNTCRFNASELLTQIKGLFDIYCKVSILLFAALFVSVKLYMNNALHLWNPNSVFICRLNKYMSTYSLPGILYYTYYWTVTFLSYNLPSALNSPRSISTFTCVHNRYSIVVEWNQKGEESCILRLGLLNYKKHLYLWNFSFF